MSADSEVTKLRKEHRLQSERYVRLLARFAALQRLLIDNLSRLEIDVLEKQFLDQSAAALRKSPDDAQEAILQLLKAFDGTIQ